MMAKTKALPLVAAILFLGAMASLTVEDRSREKLEQTRESLTREFAALQNQNSTLSNQLAHSENIKSTSLAQSSELAQLRAEVVTLRQNARDFSALQRQNQELCARLPSQRSSLTNQLSPDDQYILESTHIMDATDVLLKAVEKYMTAHDGQYPEDFAQLASFGLPDDGRLSANLTIDDFEWLPASTLGPPGGRYLFRNRVPIPEPGKDPVWVYGFSTGGKITTSADFTSP